MTLNLQSLVYFLITTLLLTCQNTPVYDVHFGLDSPSCMRHFAEDNLQSHFTQVVSKDYLSLSCVMFFNVKQNVQSNRHFFLVQECAK